MTIKKLFWFPNTIYTYFIWCGDNDDDEIVKTVFFFFYLSKWAPTETSTQPPQITWLNKQLIIIIINPYFNNKSLQLSALQVYSNSNGLYPGLYKRRGCIRLCSHFYTTQIMYLFARFSMATYNLKCQLDWK